MGGSPLECSSAFGSTTGIATGGDGTGGEAWLRDIGVKLKEKDLLPTVVQQHMTNENGFKLFGFGFLFYSSLAPNDAAKVKRFLPF